MKCVTPASDYDGHIGEPKEGELHRPTRKKILRPDQPVPAWSLNIDKPKRDMNKTLGCIDIDGNTFSVAMMHHCSTTESWGLYSFWFQRTDNSFIRVIVDFSRLPSYALMYGEIFLVPPGTPCLLDYRSLKLNCDGNHFTRRYFQ